MKGGINVNDKQRAFAVEYVKDRNATQAAIRAGYSARTAYSQAHELLKKPEIQSLIKELEDAAADRAAITVDKIVARLNKIAEDPNAKDSDKIRADELLGKYLGMFSERLNLSGSVDTGTEKLAEILAQLRQ